MEVKRFTVNGELVPHDKGEVVLTVDHVAALAEKDTECDAHEFCLDSDHALQRRNEYKVQLATLSHRIEQLEGALRAMLNYANHADYNSRREAYVEARAALAQSAPPQNTSEKEAQHERR